jgi:hypothetical protein
VDTSIIPIFESEVEREFHGILKESVNITSQFKKLKFQPWRKFKINIPCIRWSLPVVNLFFFK